VTCYVCKGRWPHVASSKRGLLGRGAHSDELVADEDEMLDGLIADAGVSDEGVLYR